MSRRPSGRSIPRRRFGPPGRVRIIAGRYRGRTLPVPGGVVLRPTTDRMRVQLFAWLDPHLAGIRVLDLCAGTGALGCEALSRGAACAVFVERVPEAADAIRANLDRLGARGEVVAGDARRYLACCPAPFDLVFLDAPFEDGRLRRALVAGLFSGGVVRAGGRLVLETPRGEDWPEEPAADWRLHRYAAYARAELRLYLHLPSAPRATLESVDAQDA